MAGGCGEVFEDWWGLCSGVFSFSLGGVCYLCCCLWGLNIVEDCALPFLSWFSYGERPLYLSSWLRLPQ